MQFNTVYLFAMATAAAAMPTSVSSPAMAIREPQTSDIRTVNMDVDIGKCTKCLDAVSATIASCAPVVQNWPGLAYWSACIDQVTTSYPAFNDDCVPCLKSFTD